jgi:exopolysaccharide transport family protein
MQEEWAMSGMGANQDADIDIGQLFGAVWERRRRIITTTALVAVLAFAGASLMTPAYKAETRILIEARGSGTGEAAQGANEPVLDQFNIASQVQLLQSADLIRQIASDLNLSSRKEFDPEASALLPDFLVLLGLKQNPLDLPAEDRVLKAFREKLQVYPLEGSRVIAVEFSSVDPKLSAEIPNRMADVYLSLQSKSKRDTLSEAAGWLEPEITALRTRVAAAERKVADYRSSAGLFQSGDNTSFSAQQLSGMSSELARVRGERANAEARAQNVRAALDAGAGYDTLGDVVGSAMIQRLKENQSLVEGEISQASITLLEGHPRLKALRAQLSGIRRQIETESRKILTSLESEASVARLREQQMIQQLGGLKADSARAGEEEVGLRVLEREAAAERQLLETYLSRYREAASRVEGNAMPADGRVVSTAIEPAEPYFPKIIPITIVLALASLILQAVGLIVVALFSGRGLRPAGERSPVELQPVLASAAEPAGSLAVAPLADQRADAVGLEGPQPGLTPVRDDLMRRGDAVAIIVSPEGDVGSTASVMLARELAGQRRSVVLLDLSGTACPTRLMAQTPTLAGITDLLCGAAAFGETIHPDRLSGAHIVPEGKADPADAMRGADRLGMIIDALAGAYEIVLVECGAADAGKLDRLMRAHQAQMVLSMGSASAERIEEARALYSEAGYPDALVMTADLSGYPPRRGRQTAA